MDYYIVTDGIHIGTLFGMICNRTVVLYSKTLKPYSFISDIPVHERETMRYKHVNKK